MLQTAINILFGVVRVVRITSARKRFNFSFLLKFNVSSRNSNAVSTVNSNILFTVFSYFLMSASLTLQIRLGFSLGWRIWTPNEVGFYAKTLAHSYFIYMILKSKLLTKLLWVVNYSVFVSKKRYLVFLEFLEFGLKTKEERTRWKKLMYISLVVRDPNKTITNKTEVENLQRINSIAKFIRKHKRFTRKLTKISRYYQKVVQNKEFFKPMIDSFQKKLPKVVRNTLGRRSTKILKKNINKKDIVCVESRNLSPDFIKSIQSFKRIRKKPLKVFFYNKKRSIIKKKKIIGKLLLCKLNTSSNKRSKVTSSVSSRSDTSTLKNANFDEIYFLEKNISLSNRVKKKYPLKFKGLLNTSHEININKVSSMLNFRRIDLKLKDPRHSSFCGGPRKRFYRNIRRSFKGKHIKTYEHLVWFWEKVSRMLTYYVKCINSGIL